MFLLLLLRAIAFHLCWTISFFATTTATTRDESLSQCFSRTTRRSIDNYPPIVEFPRTSIMYCMSQCITASGNADPTTCRSFTFDRTKHTCRLYDHDGSAVPAILFPAKNVDLFQRTKSEGLCAGRTVLPTQLKSDNSQNFFILHSREDKANFITTDSDFRSNLLTTELVGGPLYGKASSVNDITSFRTHSAEYVPVSNRGSTNSSHKLVMKPVVYSAPTRRVEGKQPEDIEEIEQNSTSSPNQSDREDNEDRSSSNSRGEVEQIENSTPTSSDDEELVRATPTPKPSAESRQCPTGIGYFVVIGNQIVAPPNVENARRVFEKVEQGTCASLCSSNKGPHGEAAPCKSLNYYPLTQRCEMFNILSEPHGPGNLLENSKVIYAEKFCMSELAVDCEPEEVFILHVQKEFKGSPFDTVPGASITSCLDRCFGRMLCQSVVFDSLRQECRIHKESVEENDSLVIDTQPGIVLIENGCRRSEPPVTQAPSLRDNETKRPRRPSSSNIRRRKVVSKSVDVPTEESDKWSEWSECVYKMRGKRLRVRSRQCRESGGDCEDGGMQVKAC